MVTPDMGAIAGKGSESWSPGGPDHGGVARSFNMDMDMNMWSRHANLHSFVSQVGCGGETAGIGAIAGKGSEGWCLDGPDHRCVAISFNMDMKSQRAN